MSSMVSGLNQVPLQAVTSAPMDVRMLSATSVDSSAKKYLHFPYPWIFDTAFVRPANGYLISGTPVDNYAAAVGHLQSDERYRTGWFAEVDNLSDTATPSTLSLRSQDTWSDGVLTMRPIVGGSSSVPRTVKPVQSAVMTCTDLQGTEVHWYSNDPMPMGAAIKVGGLNNQFSKIHATFFYEVDYNYMNGTVGALPTVSLGSECRYQQNPSANLGIVGSTLNSVLLANGTKQDNSSYVIRVVRIAWDSRQVISPQIGDPIIEVPALVIRVIGPVLDKLRLAIRNVQCVIVASKQ